MSCYKLKQLFLYAVCCIHRLINHKCKTNYCCFWNSTINFDNTIFVLLLNLVFTIGIHFDIWLIESQFLFYPQIYFIKATRRNSIRFIRTISVLHFINLYQLQDVHYFQTLFGNNTFYVAMTSNIDDGHYYIVCNNYIIYYDTYFLSPLYSCKQCDNFTKIYAIIFSRHASLITWI